MNGNKNKYKKKRNMQLSSFMKRPRKEDLDEALILLGLPSRENFECIDYMKLQVEAARTKNLKNLMVKYSVGLTF